MKRILDTVHGYIMVPDELVKNIIDTSAFQRLRRIEQTSIRSVYPSARHDRFIHSLGVYHIGSLIVDHLRKEEEANDFWGETANNMSVIYNSYLVACLLHDVGHAPFSHTFENYYGQKIDIRVPVSRDGKIVGETIDIEQLQEATKYEGRLELRSKKATYKLPSSTSNEIRSSIVDNKNYDLTKFKNLKLLFLSNLMTALQKSHWDDAYELAKLLIKKGKLAAVYNSYIKSNIQIVFEYNEGVTDGNSDHQIFIDKLKKEANKAGIEV